MFSVHSWQRGIRVRNAHDICASIGQSGLSGGIVFEVPVMTTPTPVTAQVPCPGAAGATKPLVPNLSLMGTCVSGNGLGHSFQGLCCKSCCSQEPRATVSTCVVYTQPSKAKCSLRIRGSFTPRCAAGSKANFPLLSHFWRAELTRHAGSVAPGFTAHCVGLRAGTTTLCG